MGKKKDTNYYLNKKYDGMMGRCYRESDRSFKNYGAAGVRVCSEWIENINNFKKWIRSELARLNISEDFFTTNSKVIQLDRIDPGGHYTPDNCRLVSPQKNMRNTKRNKGKVIVSAEGKKYVF